MVDEWLAFHDRTGADYQRQWNTLVPQGFRLVQGSVYGPRNDPRYAGLWVKRPAPDTAGFHGPGRDRFHDFLERHRTTGWIPTVLSISGSAADPVHLCVMEQRGWTWFTRHGLTLGAPDDPASLGYWLRRAAEHDWLPRTLCAYGTPSDPRYALVCVPNDARLLWGAEGPESADAYQQRFTAQTRGFSRPSIVAPGPSGWMSVFTDDELGAFQAHHGLDSPTYQRVFEQRVQSGLVPVVVQAGNTPDGPRFAAVFARDNRPQPRRLTISGPRHPVFARVDEAVTERMRATGVRAAQIALTRFGRLVHAPAFTWAEPNYPVTRPESLFRLASVSKPITAIVVFSLIDEGRLRLDDAVLPKLGLTPLPNRPFDPAAATITVRQLLTHTSGYTQPGDVHAMAIEAETTLPITERQVAAWVLSRPPQFRPGTTKVYSNAGYLLLGLLIEAITNGRYEDAVRSRVWSRLDVSRPRLASSDGARQPAGSVRHHAGFGAYPDLPVVPSVTSEHSVRVGNQLLRLGRPPAALPYGGEAYEVYDAFGGWTAAAVDVARLACAFDRTPYPLLGEASRTTMLTRDGTAVAPGQEWLAGYAHGWVRGPSPVGGTTFSHGGSIAGARAGLEWTDTGWGLVTTANGDDGDFHEIVAAAVRSIPLDAWPLGDHFPAVGIG